MPSNKEPVEVVQPGPGRLADGTVSATALAFPIGAGSNAALQAHTTDPSGAHPSSAISTPSFGGSGTRSAPAGSVESALTDVYNALNTQAVWVLHVAGTSANSDFFGSNALILAMTQIVGGGARRILFLKAGIYTWDDSQVFDGVTIIGDGVGTVEIRNTGGALRIGSDATFKNVLINVSGDLTFSGTGRNSLQNVLLDVDGVVNVATQSNNFTQVTRSEPGSPLYFNVTDSHNAFIQVTASQLSDSSPFGNQYQDLVLNGDPRDPTNPVLLVDTAHAIFSGVTIAPTGPASSYIIHVTGFYNTFRNVFVSRSVFDPASGFFAIFLAGSKNVLEFVRIASCSYATILYMLGANHIVRKLTMENLTSSAQMVSVAGTFHVLEGLEFENLTNVNVPLVTMSGTDHVVRNVSVVNTTVAAASSGFRFLKMGGTNCLVDGFTARGLATLGATSPLFDFTQATTGATIENVVLSGLGSTVRLAAPLVRMPNTVTNTQTMFRNWLVENVAVDTAGTPRLFDFDLGFVDGACLEDLSFTGCSSVAGPLDYLYFQQSTTTVGLRRVLVNECRVVNNLAADTLAGAHRAVVCNSTYNPVDVQNSCFQTNAASQTSFTAVIYLAGSADASFTNCTIIGPKCVATSTTGAGVVFTNCIFKSVFTFGPTGEQLVSGHGRLATATTPAKPFMVRDCTMLVSACNSHANATTRPLVFFGGNDTTAPAGHGAVVVDGLFIGRNPTETFTNSHRSPFLTIDTASQHAQVASSFSNITIDLEGVPFTGSALNSAVFSDYGPSQYGAVVELHGPGSTQAVSRSTLVSGLRLLRLPRNGGSGAVRAAILARGVTIKGLVVDAVSGTSGDWGYVVSANYCVLADAEFYPTTSLPTATSHLWAQNETQCQRLFMRNFTTEQDHVAFISASSLSDSTILMPAGSLVGAAGSAIVQASSATFGEEECWIVNNRIKFTQYAASATDVAVAIQCSGERLHVVNNDVKNLAQASASGYSTIAGSSNGGGAQIKLAGSRINCTGNTIQFQWENHTDYVMSITSSGDRNNIIGNFTKNTAIGAHSTYGGTNVIQITGGLYNNVSDNVIEATNVQFYNVRLDTSGGASGLFMGNRIDNAGAGDKGYIQTSSTDKPEPGLNSNDPSTTNFNQLT